MHNCDECQKKAEHIERLEALLKEAAGSFEGIALLCDARKREYLDKI